MEEEQETKLQISEENSQEGILVLVKNTVCWSCGDQATTEYEGQPLCTECFNYLMLEMTSSYADFDVASLPTTPKENLMEENTDIPF